MTGSKLGKRSPESGDWWNAAAGVGLCHPKAAEKRALLRESAVFRVKELRAAPLGEVRWYRAFAP